MKPLMYRKRYIPQDTKSLNDDEILLVEDGLIVTSWKTFKPKKEFARGISCTFTDRGYKISKFMKEDGELVYYYCDIIHSEYLEESNTWIFTDLLADVRIYPNGLVEVVDLDETADALEKGLISAETAAELLRKLDSLLELIYSGKWHELTDKYFN